jgi:hypothetical protein
VSDSHLPAVRGLAFVLATISAAPAPAFDFDVDNPNLRLSLLADVRYNLGVRVEARDPAVVNHINFDESDSRFDKGEVVTNRLDITPQLELVYEPGWDLVSAFGFRATGNAFRDYAYDDDRLACRPGTSPVSLPATANTPATKFPDETPPGRVSYCDPRLLSYSSGEYNDTARKSAFEKAEWLEGFAFANLSLFERPVNLKVGRHAVFWGEALINPVLGVGYSMGPVDVNKALSVPGATAQDILRPVNQATGTIGVTDTVSLGFQYLLDWEGLVAPAGGTYLGLLDFIIDGPDQLYVANLPTQGPLSLKHFPDLPGGDRQNGYGARLAWTPDLLAGGALALYYRRFDDIVPWFGLVPDPNNPALPMGYRFLYGTDSELYGLTASGKFLDLSLGADFAYVPNRMLVSQQTLADDTLQRARGRVWSGVLNAVYLGPEQRLPFTDIPLWDGSLLIVEFNGSYLDRVTERPETYKEAGSDACTADIRGALGPGAEGDTADGCVRGRHSVGYSVVFTPSWFQVFPGIDMNANLVYSAGLEGNSPAVFGGNEGTVSGRVAVGATFYNIVTATLAYNFYDSLVRRGTNLDGEPAALTWNGVGIISDRDWVSLTLKYSF